LPFSKIKPKNNPAIDFKRTVDKLFHESVVAYLSLFFSYQSSAGN
jgi:hypothetical protein